MLKNMRNGWRVAALGAILGTGVLPAGALELPFGLGARERAPVAAAPATGNEQPIRMAQIGDAGQRISQLEEENRRLNGKVEELSFQVLQMQEQMRKMQEDNEFRFQEIEGAKPAGGGGGGGQKRSDVAPPAPTATASASAQPPAVPGDEIGSLLGQEGGGLDSATVTNSAAPRAASSPPAAPGVPSNTVAAIQTKNAGELYGLAYNYLLAGDYQLAETSFRQYTQTYPDAKDVPDARYWLGESQFQQAKYTDAAETFLNAQKDYPRNAKAPEMMLKLGMSLAKLDNRDTACVTFKEVSRRYPQMSSTVKRKLQTETQAARC